MRVVSQGKDQLVWFGWTSFLQPHTVVVPCNQMRHNNLSKITSTTLERKKSRATLPFTFPESLRFSTNGPWPKTLSIALMSPIRLRLAREEELSNSLLRALYRISRPQLYRRSLLSLNTYQIAIRMIKTLAKSLTEVNLVFWLQRSPLTSLRCWSFTALKSRTLTCGSSSNFPSRAPSVWSPLLARSASSSTRTPKRSVV